MLPGKGFSALTVSSSSMASSSKAELKFGGAYKYCTK